MKNLPPPENVNTTCSVPDGLPDYVAGHIIYYDPDCGLHWVVYDGPVRNNFASRRAAIRFAIQCATKISSSVVSELIDAQAITRHLSDRLGKFFLVEHQEITRDVQAISARLRALSDALDNAAAHCIDTIKNNERKEKETIT